MPDNNRRVNASFTEDQEKFVILKYGEVRCFRAVRRAFAAKFYPRHPRKVHGISSFHRVISRFLATSSCVQKSPPGLPLTSNDDIDRVKAYFEENESAHIRRAAYDLGLSYGTVWRILRTKLKWKSFRSHQVQCLSPAHVQSRLSACTYWIQFPEQWFERVIWTDEKWFVLQQAPNRQIDRFWAPVHPHHLIECKKTRGDKCMAWAGIVDGKCLPIVWFEGSVNGEVYLKLLKDVLWPSIKAVATKKQYWFQQDGATCHVTQPCLDFLKLKFGDRILSRKTDHHWPPNSPDLSPLDFSFWSQAMNHLNEVKPKTLAEMKITVENFASNLSDEAIRKMARHTRKRAVACVAAGGGHFEQIIKLC